MTSDKRILPGMRVRPGLVLAAVLAVSAAIAPAFAQNGLPTAPGVLSRKSDKPVDFADLPAPRRFVTEHKGIAGGKRITWRATAGETYVSNIHGEPVARIFSFDYVRTGPQDPSRPVLFVFNGGPGSASLWLHMGVVGPRRAVLSPEVNPRSTPPFGPVDNPDTLLDVADLVFIDPVGTGFSHAVGNASDLDFASVDVDADTAARFIELWLTRNGRWNSPKYLVGESYGTVRAAVLTRTLMGGPLYSGVMRGITLDGVVLVGSALNIGSVVAAPQDRPDPATGRAIPGMAVTAWYHGKIDRAGRTAAQVYEEARQFGEGDYAAALWKQKNGKLEDTERNAVADRLAALTGLSADTWIKAGLAMPVQAYLKQVLAADDLEAGAYDSRYTLPLAQSGGDPVADDPAMGRYVPGFVAAFHTMLHDDLKVDMPIPYTAIAWGDLNGKWSYKRAGVPEGSPFTTDLAIALRRNPSLRVMFATGLYDMVTNPASAAAQARQIGAPDGRVEVRQYESGHMLYLGGTARQFSDDLRAFVQAGAPR